MKKVLFAILVITLTASAAFAQNHTWNGPQLFAAPLTVGNQFVLQSETISKHLDTPTGKKPLVYITATRLDTVKLLNARYATGQVVRLLTSTTTNDSTCLVPSSGTINGGAYYWLTNSGGTYKSASIYFNGTNWFIIK